MPLNIVTRLNEEDRYMLYVLACSPDHLEQKIIELENENIPVLDVGFELSMSLKGKFKFLDILAYENIVEIINNRAIKISPLQKRIVAIHNLGILMEPSLSLNGSKILKELSKNIHMVILWENKIDQPGKLHWGNQADRFYFDFTDINLKNLQ